MQKEQLHKLFYNVPAAYMVCDVDGIIIQANKLLIELLGDSNLIRTSFPRFSTPRHHHTYQQHVKKLLKEGGIQKDVIELTLKNSVATDIAIVSVSEQTVTGDILICSVLVDKETLANDDIALLKKVERLELAIRGSLDGLWDWDPVSDDMWFSEHFYEMLGYENNEFVPSYDFFLNALHPNDKDRVDKAVMAHLENQVPYSLDYRLQKKNGEYCCFHTAGKALWDSDKKPVRFIGSISDISVRKKAEKKLVESEIKFRDLTEGSLQGVFVHRDFKPLYANQKCADIFGYSDPAEILKLNSILEVFWLPEEQKRIRGYLMHRLAGDEVPNIYETRGMRKDGSEFWFENYVSVIEWQGENAIQAAVIDITERKKVEDELTKTASLLKNVINTSQDLIYVKDTELRTVLCNNFFAQALGKKPEDLYGRTDIENGWPEAFVKGDSNQGIRGYEIDDREVLAGKTINIAYEPVSIKNEIRFFNTIKSPLTDESGKVIGLLGIARDDTHRKDMEDELKHMATHDSLTGLYNRQVLEQRMSDEIERASRYKHSMSIFMLDVDHFKSINDTYGHSTGDAMLREMAKVLMSSVRKSDYVARYGGEEFIVVLPETSLDKAEELAERLRMQVDDYSFPINDNENINLTVSIGIASFPKHAEFSNELIDMADSAMYAAKKAGRNQIKIP